MGLFHISLQFIAAALIGWFVNWLFIRLVLKRIASNQSVLADRIGAAAQQLFNIDDIAGKIKDPSNLQSVKPIIESHVDTFLQVKLKEKMPAIAMFVSGSTLDKLKDGLLEEIDVLLPEVIAGYAGNMGRDMDVQKMVSAKIKAIPPAQLKQQIRTMLGKELLIFKLMGAATGILIAILQLTFSLSWFWLTINMSQ